MKISNILIALMILFSIACSLKRSSDEHGHEHDGTEEQTHSHDDDADHVHDEAHEQEEFTISADSVEAASDSTHTHDDGSTHHDH